MQFYHLANTVAASDYHLYIRYAMTFKEMTKTSQHSHRALSQSGGRKRG